MTDDMQQKITIPDWFYKPKWELELEGKLMQIRALERMRDSLRESTGDTNV